MRPTAAQVRLADATKLRAGAGAGIGVAGHTTLGAPVGARRRFRPMADTQEIIAERRHGAAQPTTQTFDRPGRLELHRGPTGRWRGPVVVQAARKAMYFSYLAARSLSLSVGLGMRERSELSRMSASFTSVASGFRPTRAMKSP